MVKKKIRMSLLQLPHHIIASEISSKLNWKSLINLTQTCHQLSTISPTLHQKIQYLYDIEISPEKAEDSRIKNIIDSIEWDSEHIKMSKEILQVICKFCIEKAILYHISMSDQRLSIIFNSSTIFPRSTLLWPKRLFSLLFKERRLKKSIDKSNMMQSILDRGVSGGIMSDYFDIGVLEKNGNSRFTTYGGTLVEYSRTELGW